LTNQPITGSLPNDRYAYLSLRYDFSAGRARPVLGGPVGGASGTVSGSVFLDENADGVRSASEQPARSVTVMLDNRFVVRTDDQGRFTFERVAVGAHTVTVVPDNLPLPWMIERDRAQRPVSVTVRGDAVVDFGAQRPR
nr:carboxypeptidase regulatory-like domain-containing protein [Arenimonas sp.]